MTPRKVRGIQGAIASMAYSSSSSLHIAIARVLATGVANFRENICGEGGAQADFRAGEAGSRAPRRSI